MKAAADSLQLRTEKTETPMSQMNIPADAAVAE